MVGDDDEMFMTRSFNFTPKTTEQNLIVRSVIKDCSMFCTIDRHETSRGLFATAELLVLVWYCCLWQLVIYQTGKTWIHSRI